MANPFLTNNTLSNFVKNLKISEKKKSFLLSKIPQLNKEERIGLLKTLIEIYFLDLEEARVIARVKKHWRKY